MKVFRMPDIGEGLAEAEIVVWHVGEGDHVVRDQPLVSVETDKAVVEIPSPWPGTVAALHGASGDIVAVGADLVSFEGEEEGVPHQGAIVGDLTADRETMPPTEAPPAPLRPATRAVPAARALARKQGIDLSGVRGTGPDGTILVADVEAAATPEIQAGYEPLRGPRRAMAMKMERAGRECVPASVTDFADVTPWWSVSADITVRMARAMIRAAEHEPALNAWFDGASRSRRLFTDVDLGLAVDTNDGLFVPVIRAAQTLDHSAIRSRIDDLIARTRARTLDPGELTGPTITLSNFGMIGGRHAALVVVPPQVAIVGAGRIEVRLALDGGNAIERHLLPLSLTFDHRAVTGGEAARFIAALRDDLERSD